MKSTIRIEMDFNIKEPVLQITLDKDSTELSDQTLRYFIECANNRGLEVLWPFSHEMGPFKPQLRIKQLESKSSLADLHSYNHSMVDEFTKFACKYAQTSDEENALKEFFNGLHHKIDLHPDLI